MMPSKIDFLRGFEGFWEGKWGELGIKIGAEIDLAAKVIKSTKH